MALQWTSMQLAESYVREQRAKSGLPRLKREALKAAALEILPEVEKAMQEAVAEAYAEETGQPVEAITA